MNELQTQRTPDLIAFEINSIKEQTVRLVISNSIEIGSRLVEAKSLVKHGEWGTWLKEQVDYSKSTANNMMKLFEEYGENQLSLFGAEVKSQALGNLNYTQAIALLALDENEREAFVKENNVDEMSTRELQRAIKEKQEAEKKLQETKEREEQLQKEKEAAEKDREKLLNEAMDKEFEMNELKKKLEDIEENTPDLQLQKDYERLTEEFAKACEKEQDAMAKVDELEKRLKEKPIEAEVKETVEVIPEDIQKELEELRKKAETGNEQQQDKNIIKFSVQFEQLVKGFNDIIQTMDGMEESEKQKYAGALISLTEKMRDKINNME